MTDRPTDGTPGTSQTPGNAKASKKKKSPLREWTETIIIAVVLALSIRALLVEVYVVKGESMEPTLHSYERVLVNKFVYRMRKPEPGEIIVLQDPRQPKQELIKRVIAVEGETVEVREGVVYVDGRPLREPYINPDYGFLRDSDAVTVPPGHIYVMGDNRGASLDSRMLGPIDTTTVDGKAIFMFWPLSRFGSGPLDQPRSISE